MQISKVIKEKGYTLQQVADKINVQRITLAKNIATGANPTINTLRKIADAIGCNMVDFFADEIQGNADGQQTICPHCGRPLHIHITAE